MTGRARVLVFAQCPEGGAEALTRAYRQISHELDGTPGLLGNELLRSEGEPGGYVVMSEWQDVDAFRSWEQGVTHRRVTAPLRPYLTGARSYEVVARYPETEH